MPQQTSPFLEVKYGWNFGESGWNVGMDENLRKFSYLFDSNIDGIVNTLPTTPVEGTAYYLTTDKRLYFVVKGVYYSTAVPQWFTVTLRTTGAVYQFNGTTLTTDLSSNAARLVTTVTQVRSLSRGPGLSYLVFPGRGAYYYDSTDTTSVDNSGNVLVSTDGSRWKLLSQSTASNQLYEEFGAVNQRFSDRSFFGGAAKNDGKNNIQQNDWPTKYQIAKGRVAGFIQNTQVAIASGDATNQQNSANALLVAARTSSLFDNYNAIGIVGIAVADKTTGTAYSYAGYFEAYREVGVSGGAYGIEIDTINYKDFVDIDPYIQKAGQTIGIQMASGGEYSPTGQFDSSVCMNIQNNGSRFGIGINFGATSITGTDGVTGTGIAIGFAKGHMQQWYSSTGNKTSSILGNCQTPALSLKQNFVDNQVQWMNVNNKNVMRVFAAANSVNYLDLRSSVTGAAVSILASGDDTNIDLALTPKGTGLIQLGAYSAGAPTATGYITVRTSAGQTVRLSAQLM